MTIAKRVEQRIKRSKRHVFIRDDFSDIGGYDQVGRALRCLCEQEILMKIGYGVYAKARRNRINGRLMVANNGGPDALFLEILDRFKVPYETCGLTADYLNGLSTQIPASMELKLKKRFSRKLSVGNKQLNGN